jgi:hypothetical protein
MYGCRLAQSLSRCKLAPNTLSLAYTGLSRRVASALTVGLVYQRLSFDSFYCHRQRTLQVGKKESILEVAPQSAKR